MGRFFAVLLALVSFWFGWQGLTFGVGVTDPVGQTLALVISHAYLIAAPLVFAAACIVGLLADLAHATPGARRPLRGPYSPRAPDGWGGPADAPPAEMMHSEGRGGAGPLHPMATMRHR